MKRLSAPGSWLAALLLMGAADNSPLITAARNTDADAIRRLVQEKTDVNAAEPDGTTALHWASYRDDGLSADLLIRAGANVNAANDLGATPLWTASLNGSTAMVRRLLEAGANPNAALLLGETPLMVAARLVVLADGQQPRVFALRSRVGLQGHGVVTRGRAQHALQVGDHLPVTAGLAGGGEGMDLAELRP